MRRNGDHQCTDTQHLTVAALRRFGRLYRVYVRAETKLVQQKQAAEVMLGLRQWKPRAGASTPMTPRFGLPPPSPDDRVAALEAVAPMEEARLALHTQRLLYRSRILACVKQLPPDVVTWVRGIKGFGPVNLGLIIGETGELHNYANPAKLWKRMGLGIVDGGAQRRSKKDAELHGFSPKRRAIMHMVGVSLMTKENDYAKLYKKRKAYERKTTPGLTKKHCHRRVSRYVEKRALKDLWRAWRSCVHPARDTQRETDAR